MGSKVFQYILSKLTARDGIILFLILVVAGTAIASNHYKKEAIRLALEKQFKEIESVIEVKNKEIKNNEIIISDLKTKLNAYSIKLVVSESEVKVIKGKLKKLQSDYDNLKNKKPNRIFLSGEVKDETAEDICNKFNVMGYSCTICSE